MLNKLAIVTTLLIATASSVSAMPIRTVYENDANSNAMELKVWKGYGLTINLMSTGETIKQVWIGDPSRFAFTSNGGLCQSSGGDSDCAGGTATVIFLRQIDPIKFPVTSSSNGSTQITVLTNDNLYQFKIVPATGNPAYTSLVVKSDSDRPLPITRPRTPLPLTVQKPQSAPSDFPQPSPPPPVALMRPNPGTTLNGAIQRNDANALAFGLAEAGRKGQVKPGSTIWNKVQDAIKLLRRGKTRDEAISLSQVDKTIFNQLLQWGQL
ncbi:TrbG/VirB9 family P-type conjugative transfer protein [Nostoc sp. UIC 10630]|uniref:TrbG/VirB9 family P-type conjugative transfer protein n=1 Tax=Nostoc sp. UIC 10630 TaxID=2100146 RepID=UPI0013D7288D|nr:TrbG/VirB9 family P-type conjugative transfer protein [Nostoc sp. UIC 10630]NEU83480.1 TrbG/VirB9 family P-type conjugative transfer protein [Nostoc sp. UIC 10630]